ncbi:putative E14 prophage; tail fiber protein (Modular protein) [Xenorhabdus nematophila F1]|uniref:tail fiber protein n=1 Tax=Xenorhabdus nematophila TaxID=628 RepID=UPI00032755EA|nr:tail fiber protein [Xenorhabdus nematophila]CCW30257.1 putative E14 prophage; tail fiber protein (Modular protein) [Xenorhabdus nematophila F1]
MKNLGLMETQNQARNAVPNTRKVNGKSLISDVILNSEDVGAFSQTKYMTNIPDQSYLGAFSCGKEGEWVKGVSIGSKGGDVGQIWVDSSAMLHTRFLNSNGNHKQQSYAILGDSYTKQESDNHFIQLNTNTKTSGYILSKAANFLDDPSSRHLGRSGFLRPNNIDNLGDLAIHVAHPSAEGAEHARGISFNYGSGSDKFGLSTYAFDKDGKFQGKKKILTEDDKDSLGSVPVGVPLPWPQDKPPSGYLICNGDRFDKSRYPRLALAYPSGVLPDLRGEFIRGLDAGRNIDSARKALSFQEHSIQSHSHSGVFTGAFERESGGRGGWGATNTNGNTAATGGTETRPRNIAFLYIVRGA